MPRDRPLALGVARNRWISTPWFDRWLLQGRLELVELLEASLAGHSSCVEDDALEFEDFRDGDAVDDRLERWVPSEVDGNSGIDGRSVDGDLHLLATAILAAPTCGA